MNLAQDGLYVSILNSPSTAIAPSSVTTNTLTVLGTSTTANSVVQNSETIGTLSPNYLVMSGAAAGASPNIASAGADANIDVRFAPKGTGRLSAAKLLIGAESLKPYVNNLTVAYIRSSATYSGPIFPGLRVGGDFSGTVSSQSTGYHQVAIDTDTVDASTGVGGTTGMFVGHTVSAGAKGGRTAFSAFLNISGAMSAGNNASTASFLVGLAGAGSASASAGGTSGAGNTKGNLFGANFVAHLLTGAGLYWNSVVGCEINVGTSSGTQAAYKVGLQIVQESTDATSGVVGPDVALSITSQPNAAIRAWDTGITFGHPFGWWPMKATSTLIGTNTGFAGTPSYAAASGVDFSNVTFSTAAFKSTGFTVDGAGAVAAKGIRGTSPLPISVASGGIGLSTNSWIYAQPFFFGYSDTNTAALNYIGIADQVNHNGASALNGLFVVDSLTGGTAAGDRNAIQGSVLVNTSPNPGVYLSDPAYVGSYGNVKINANLRGVVGAVSPTSYNGAAFGGWSYAIAQSGATGLQSVIGHEINVLNDPGSSMLQRWGLALVNKSAYGDRGTYSDVGLLMSGPPFKHMIAYGTATSGEQAASDTTILSVNAKLYGIAGVPTAPGILRGVDFQAASIDAAGFAFGSPNFQVSSTGALSANGVTTTRDISAQTATMTNITINDGGVYSTFPTVSIQAPPSGVTATATVATMGGVANGPAGVLGFGATGKNYLVGDVLTYPSGGGAAGTSPTFTVSTVDAAGGITGLTVTTNGSLTSAAANPLYLTGGAGTGAAVNLTYTRSTNTFVPSTIAFAATGSGYVVGVDVLTVTGDTGTAIKYNVAAVDSFGGITAVTINTVGSLTVLAGTTYRATTSTGVGVGATIRPGYKILTFATSAGSGYPAAPAPLIYTSTSTWKVADLTAVMTAASADMRLNPSGGVVSLGQVFTVAGLPAAGTAGRRGFVSDATVTTFASAVVGGGANKVPVYDDGTNWRIG